MSVASIDDLRLKARRRLPPFLFEYLDGGSWNEVTLENNRADLRSISLRARVLQDVSAIDLSSSVLGQSLAMPAILAPIGLGGMFARRGERSAARAAVKAGVPFCLSTVAACSIEEVRAAVATPFWFQLYMIRDRGFMADLMARAEAAGVTHLVFTVDMPVPATRWRDMRSGLAGAPGPLGDLRRIAQALRHPDWAVDVGLLGRPHTLGNVAPVLKGKTGLEDFFAWMRDNFDASVTWKDLEWVRSRWKGPIILKGVLDREDALMALQVGVDALVVSNHGGRQLDGALSPVRALPGIIQAIGSDIPVLADGGVRSGLDIVKLLCLGASAVLIGRAWAYGLAAGGEAGVDSALEILRKEMCAAMALMGCINLRALSSDCLVRLPEGG